MKKMTPRQIRAYIRQQTRDIADPVKKRRVMEGLVTYAIYAERRGICWRVPSAKI